KILVSAVRFRPSPPQNQAVTMKIRSGFFLWYNIGTTIYYFIFIWLLMSAILRQATQNIIFTKRIHGSENDF
ncbi:MAG TPA: hypothetical protein DCM71_06850, partial [Runella sp.]|nr:hypothetical protein [Runella sp.]